MKRLISLFLSICMIVMLVACGTNIESSSALGDSSVSDTDNDSEVLEEAAGGDETNLDSSGGDDVSNTLDSGSNILVAYFSCTGTTEQIAQWIADEVNADVYQIIPETAYTDADLNYNNSSSRANQEQADDTCRPAISGSVENMEQYDIVFIGYPIWHSQAPRIISTFLESYDFSGVTIVPFCTSHSSGIGSSADNLHSLCSDTAIWLDGQRFSGDATESEVVEWVNSLDLPEEEERIVGEFDFETKKYC